MARIKKIPHSESAGRTLMLLLQTARLIRKYVDAYFYRKTSVSFTKFMVLKLINSTNETMNQTQIAEWTQTEQHNIVTLINRLKKEGS
jgi:DNA-binding MarR family transcriptional regulator